MKNKAAAAQSWQLLTDRRTHWFIYVRQIITCFRTVEFLRLLHRERERCKRKICHYVPRESALMLQSLVMLCLSTYAHVLRTPIDHDRKIISLVAMKTNFNTAVVHESVSLCIFPSYTPPTWQGNSQSSDLKEGETGRGGGEGEWEREGFSKSRTRNIFRCTERGKYTSSL